MAKSSRRNRDYREIHGKKFKESFDTKNKYKDERFWTLTRDDTGGGSAIIRFLPNKNEVELPYKQSFKHAININGKMFIDHCPTTVDENCPVCEWNKEQDRDFVMDNKTYRKKSYICNILVIQDKKNRDNEGKVFLFEFGKQVYDILVETLNPDKELGIDPMYYYCLDNGANFRVLVKKDGKYPTWTSSKFLPKSPIDGDLETLNIDDDYIFDNIYDIGEVIKSKKYKTYDELNVKFKKFLKSIDANGMIDDAEYDNKEENVVPEFSRKTRKSKEIIEEKEKSVAVSNRTSRKSNKVDDDMDKVNSVQNYFHQYDDDDDE